MLVISSMALAGGCAQRASRAERGLAQPVVVIPVAPSPPEPAAASAPATVAPAARAPLESFDAMVGAVWKRCAPADLGESMSEMKISHADANACIERHVVTALDQVLLPLKLAGSARFHTLMAQEARFNRFAGAYAALVEDTSWIDPETGRRTFGSGYDCERLQCDTSSSEERLFYARALQRDDAAALAQRVQARQKAGEAELRKLRAWAQTAARRPLSADARDAWPWGWTAPVSDEDWKAIADAAREVETDAGALAASTCDDFPGLSGALGGSQACRREVSRYYLAHCEFDH